MTTHSPWRAPSARARENARLEVAIHATHQRPRQTYGPERLRDGLKGDGFQAGVGRIKRLRKKLGIRCRQVRKFRATTNSNHPLPVASNLLDQNFETTRPNETWVTDITCVSTGEGWLYLSGIKVCTPANGSVTRESPMDSRMTTALVDRALAWAVGAKRPGPGLIHHSDRGSQYCAGDYQALLRQFGMKTSMSRKGNCYGNAPMESFWGTLKNELVHHRRYATREQAIREITEYIEIFYNRQRRHSRLGNLSPAMFAQQYYRKRHVA